jgi:hypothetical protein
VRYADHGETHVLVARNAPEILFDLHIGDRLDVDLRTVVCEPAPNGACARSELEVLAGRDDLELRREANAAK